MALLNPIGFSGSAFNIVDIEKFSAGIDLIKESLFDKGATLYASDNIITWNRNYSFLRDDFFLEILNSSDVTSTEKCIVWRTYILLYFAVLASKKEGDFIELGCYTGHTAMAVIKKVPFQTLGKNYYLYDLFEWNETHTHNKLKAFDKLNVYQYVCERFTSYDFVKIIKGSVPQSFSYGFPEKIAFAHIDLNQPIPEAGALELLIPRLVSGGVIVFDDYGWWGYSAQKIALDPIIEEHGCSVLELPTGQALLVKT